MDEVAEDELIGEQATVGYPEKLGALFALIVGRFDVMGLVAEVELFHHGCFHYGLLVGVVEGGHAADHDAEEARIGWLSRGPVEEGFETRACLIDGDCGRHAVGAVAVHETDAGVDGAAELGFFELIIQFGGFGTSSVGEVVGGGDAVLEVIERAEEGEPVHVLGGGFGGVDAVEIVDPAGEGFVGGETTVGGLP